MKVLLRGPLLTNSGYGIHSRQLFEWLYKREDIELTVECLNWGRTSWLLDSNLENGIIGKIMSKSKPVEKGSYDYTFQVQLPDEWDNSLGIINIGVTALVETDKCSKNWVECCNKMDKIIVPSTFTKNVLLNSGIVNKPVYVIQEWFDNRISNKSLIDKTLNDVRYKNIKTDFNILVVGTLTGQNENDDRKNIIKTLEWCCQEFKDNSKVGIVLKTSFGKGSEIDKKFTKEFLQNKIKKIRSGEYPKIYLVHGNLKSEEIISFYHHHKIKVFALATKGEGYGLPLIESAASGLPIITTNWSGHLEFLEPENFNPVDYQLVDVDKSKIDGRIFIEGTKWANPDEASFKKQLKYVYENYDIVKEKSKKMKKNIVINFNSSIIMKKYDEIFKQQDK